jgi:hypothetical protein
MIARMSSEVALATSTVQSRRHAPGLLLGVLPGLAPVAAAIARSRRWKKHRRRSGSFSQPLVMQ